MSEDYEQQAERAERELADMQRQGERVEAHIDETRKDWEQKKADPAVPGAAGDPERAEEGGRHPETAYPAKGSSDEASADDESGGADGGDMPPPDPHETD
jgi:multidrug resistance efflux pump